MVYHIGAPCGVMTARSEIVTKQELSKLPALKLQEEASANQNECRGGHTRWSPEKYWPLPWSEGNGLSLLPP